MPPRQRSSAGWSEDAGGVSEEPLLCAAGVGFGGVWAGRRGGSACVGGGGGAGQCESAEFREK